MRFGDHKIGILSMLIQLDPKERHCVKSVNSAPQKLSRCKKYCRKEPLHTNTHTLTKYIKDQNILQQPRALNKVNVQGCC